MSYTPRARTRGSPSRGKSRYQGREAAGSLGSCAGEDPVALGGGKERRISKMRGGRSGMTGAGTTTEVNFRDFFSGHSVKGMEESLKALAGFR